MANDHPNFTNIFNNFMPPQQDPFGGFMDARGMNPITQQTLEIEMLKRQRAYAEEANERHRQNARKIDEKLTNNPLDEAGNPLPWSQG